MADVVMKLFRECLLGASRRAARDVAGPRATKLVAWRHPGFSAHMSADAIHESR